MTAQPPDKRRAIPYLPPAPPKQDARAIPYLPPVPPRQPLPPPPPKRKLPMWGLAIGAFFALFGVLMFSVLFGVGVILSTTPTPTPPPPTPTPHPLITQLTQGIENGTLDPTLNRAQIVEQAERVLATPLEWRIFDPVTGNSVFWTVPEWREWLRFLPDNNSPLGVAFSLDVALVRDYLTLQAQATFDESRYIDVESAIATLQDALAQGTPFAVVSVKHHARTHLVQSGETLTSIGWAYGVPYLYLQALNGGQEVFSVGQTLIIPPADYFLTLPPPPEKRIVVSIGEQRTRVYESGQLIREWVSSTGITDSPTWTGVYQVLSKELNAYAGNWNLYMPYFIGVYRPVPNAEFTNGFHGFPTRGGGQILWENSLGRRVTFGCILLDNANAKWLYEWVELGVVVEIRA